MTLLTKNIALMKTKAQEHIAADAVVGREYWLPSDNAVGGTGCFIGCLTHSDDPRILKERFGFPIMLTRVVENIFEALPSADKPRFFGDIPAAIDCDGKDLTRVVWAFLAEELRELPKVSKDVQAAIDPVIVGMDLLASRGSWPLEDANAATRAAYAAAYAAPDVARAAGAAGFAAYVARAAAGSADSARAATYAAAYAADAAEAAVGARKRQAARILRLIAEAPVIQSDEVLYDT